MLNLQTYSFTLPPSFPSWIILHKMADVSEIRNVQSANNSLETQLTSQGSQNVSETLGAVQSEAPHWIEKVEQRIKNSIASKERQEEEPGRWLSEAVAKAAHAFLRNSASSILPGEPFIYSSRNGHLVAEFEAADDGRLTVILSPTSTILFASTQDDVFKKELDPRDPMADIFLFHELTKAAQMLGIKHHASVGTTEE